MYHGSHAKNIMNNYKYVPTCILPASQHLCISLNMHGIPLERHCQTDINGASEGLHKLVEAGFRMTLDGNRPDRRQYGSMVLTCCSSEEVADWAWLWPSQLATCRIEVDRAACAWRTVTSASRMLATIYSYISSCRICQMRQGVDGASNHPLAHLKAQVM